MKLLELFPWSVGMLYAGIWLSVQSPLTAQPSNPGSFGQEEDIKLTASGSNTLIGVSATCPADIYITAQPGQQGANVSWAPIPVQTKCTSCKTAVPNTLYIGDFNGHQYFLSTIPMDWKNAHLYAIGLQTNLISIQTATENAWVVSKLNGQGAWTGANDIIQEGNFVWSDNSPFVFANWGPGQPDNANTNEDAVVITGDGFWFDINEGINRPFLLEIPCVSAVQTEGLPKGSFFPLGTTKITYKIIDACGNSTWCSFNVHVQAGIQANCPADIVAHCQPGLNGAVVTWNPPTAQTNCQDCDKNVQGMDLGVFNGSHYYCTWGAMGWEGGKAYAESQGGHLLSVSSQAENTFIANQINVQEAWIGLSDLETEGVFKWVNSQPLNWTHWASGHPLNNSGHEDVVMLMKNGQWKTAEKWLQKECIFEVPCLEIVQIEGPPSGSVFPVGITLITYKITDGCGNIGYCSFKITVKETVSIQCPPNQSVACQPGLNGAMVTWDLPQASSCCKDCQQGSPIPGFIYMGSYQGSQYYCSLQPASWFVANLTSSNLGGHLVSINDLGENNFLASQLGNMQAWIGLHDSQIEGQFQWVNGDPLTFTSWLPGQPDNGGPGGNEDYVTLGGDGYWRDHPGNPLKEYIMEKPCIALVQTSGPPPGSFFPVGQTIITYKATDGCGNTAICSFTITVASCCSAPAIQCPKDWVACPETSIHPNVTGWPTCAPPNGNCGNIVYEYSDVMISQGNCWDKKIKRTWKAFWSLNPAQYSTCEQIIELKDVTPPVVMGCPKDLTLDPGPDCQPLCVHWNTPTATDNCSSVTVTSTHQPGSYFPVGTTTVTYTFTDACGNKAYCTFKITVKSCCTPPGIQCPKDWVACPETSTHPNVTGWPTCAPPNGNCGNIVYEYSDVMISQGICWDKKIKRTWKAFWSLNPAQYSTCEQIIELKDVTPPDVKGCPKDLTLDPGPDCQPICVHWNAPTATDNCSSVTVTSTHQPGSYFSLGTTTVTYTFTDACGNKAYCTFKITVKSCCPAPGIQCPEDWEACPETSIHPNVTGWPTCAPPNGNCGNIVYEYNDVMISQGNCWDKKIKRVWKAYWSLFPSHFSTCEQWIELKDNISPTFTSIPPDMTLCPDENAPLAQPQAVDNCGTVTLVKHDEHLSGNCKLGGEKIKRTWIATDACGNSSSAIQWITFQDQVFPQIWDCPKDIYVSPGSDCKAIVYWVPPTATDNCGPVQVVASHQPGAVFEGGTITTVVYQFIDFCGNITECKFKINVEECCVPPGLKCPPKYVGCPGDFIDPIVTGTPSLEGQSHCGLLELTYHDITVEDSGCPGSAGIGRFWRISVDNQPEKYNECEQWIILEDKTGPIFQSCPEDIVIVAEAYCQIPVIWEEPLAYDWCSDITVEQTHLNGDVFYPGTYEVQYWANDACGFYSFCIFKIDIVLKSEILCHAGSESSSDLWVEKIELKNAANENGNNCGWGSMDMRDYLLAWGDEVNLTIYPGYGNGDMPSYVRVWIDYNKDGDFYDLGEMVYDSKDIGYGPVTAVFTIPEYAVAGENWMRIAMKYTDYDADSGLPQPCGIFPKGEVEDVQVMVGKITSSTDVSQSVSARLIPNPAVDNVTLQYEGISLHQIILVDVHGREQIVERNMTHNRSGEIMMDLMHVSPGIYQLLLFDAKGLVSSLPLIKIK